MPKNMKIKLLWLPHSLPQLTVNFTQNSESLKVDCGFQRYQTALAFSSVDCCFEICLNQTSEFYLRALSKFTSQMSEGVGLFICIFHEF